MDLQDPMAQSVGEKNIFLFFPNICLKNAKKETQFWNRCPTFLLMLELLDACVRFI